MSPTERETTISEDGDDLLKMVVALRQRLGKRAHGVSLMRSGETIILSGQTHTHHARLLAATIVLELANTRELVNEIVVV